MSISPFSESPATSIDDQLGEAFRIVRDVQENLANIITVAGLTDELATFIANIEGAYESLIGQMAALNVETVEAAQTAETNAGLTAEAVVAVNASKDAAADSAAASLALTGQVTTDKAATAASASSAAASAVVAGAARDEVLALGAGKWYDTYAHAAAATWTAGQGCAVIASDTGTHTDPVVGGTVANSGYFIYSASPAGLKRVGDLESTLTDVDRLAAAASAALAGDYAGDAAEVADGYFASAVKAAAGRGTAQLLLTAATPKTYKIGSSTLIERMDPLIVPSEGAYLGQGANTLDSAYAGPVPKPTHPTIDVGRILFYGETGFVLKDASNAQIGLTDFGHNWSCDIIFEVPPLAATFASVAAMNAAAATHNTGEMVAVTGGDYAVSLGAPTWDPVPHPAVKVASLAPTDILRGYYIKTYAGFQRVYHPFAYQHINATPGSKYASLLVEPRGQLAPFLYDAVTANTGRVVLDLIAMAQEGPVHLHMSRNGDENILRVNGKEYATTAATVDFVADRFCLNGVNLGAYSFSPFNGLTWLCHALSFTKDCTYQEALSVSNTLAAHFGMPVREEAGVAYLVVNYDQSRTSGTTDASTTPANPDPVSNWAFELEGSANTDNYHLFPTNGQVPDTFCSQGGNRRRVGVFFPSFNGYGFSDANQSYVQGSGTTMETIEAGLSAQLRKHMPEPSAPIYIAGHQAGGAALAALQATDSTFLYDLLDPDVTPAAYRSILYATILAMVKHARGRGWRLIPIGILNQQGETNSYTPADNPIIGDLHEADLRTVQDVVRTLCGRSDTPPICIKKAISYSYNGTSNSYNVVGGGAYAQDNQFYRIQEGRDFGFRYAMVSSIYGYMGRGIHWPVILQRHLGMILGDKLGRAFFKNEDVTPLDWTAQISGSNVVITFDRPVELVQYNGPFVTGYGRVDGVQGTGYINYGFEFSGVVSGRTQSANATFNAGARTLTIPLSGTAAVGDIVSGTGTYNCFTNIREATDNIGELATQAWSALPLADTKPVIDYTAPAHLEDWAVPKRVTLTAGVAR